MALPLPRLLVVAALLLGASSCCSDTHRSLPGDWDVLPSRFKSRSDSDPSSRQVLLVADNQLHNVYSEPVALLRTGLADELVGTAIRPPQLDLFGQDLLRLVVDEQSGEAVPVLHLGDGADLSCRDEFLAFLDIMAEAKGGWFWAPGNHDGMFFGNEYPDPGGSRWRAACSGGGGPLTKSDAIRLYLAALLHGGEEYALQLAALTGVPRPQPNEALRAYVGRVADAVPASGQWMADPQSQSVLRGIAWRIHSAEHGYESWIVQWIDLTVDPSFPVGMLVLDTAAYGFRPALLPPHNAGLAGDVGSEQIAAAEPWLAAADPATTWTLAGHHPFDALGEDARERVDRLRRRLGCLLYVSAHTHSGHYIVHGLPDLERPADLSDPEAWLELNVGSVLDWPQEYRNLSFFRYADFEREGAPLRVGFRSERTTLRELLETRLGNPPWPEWLPSPGDPDYSLRYARLQSLDAAAAEIALKNGLLGLHRRLLQLFPTDAGAPVPWPRGLQGDPAVITEITRVLGAGTLDEKTAFLLELREFEQARPLSRADAGKRDRFRLGLATVASRYEFQRARHPLEDDWYLVFPAK